MDNSTQKELVSKEKSLLFLGRSIVNKSNEGEVRFKTAKSVKIEEPEERKLNTKCLCIF